MSALRNRLLLLVVATGLTLGVLPAAPSAQAAHPAVQQVAEGESVTLELSKDSIKVGGRFDAIGTVTNVPQGTQVRLQRGTGGVWTTVATTTTTSPAGEFSLTNVTASDTGAFLYRALAGSGTTVTSGYSWLIVTERRPPTIVSGYVQAGGPVSGSRVLIYLKGQRKPVRTSTSQNGYFLVKLPALPKSLLVVATDGHGPIGKFKGTMTALVKNPTTHNSFYVNPATTLVAAYQTIHPKATLATAWAKVRGLLGLAKYHNLEWALGGRPSYFDSVKFLRTAKKHGGFDAYVAHLVGEIGREGKAASFRSASSVMPAPALLRDGGSAVAGLIGTEAAGYLGVASQAAGIINASTGLMNLVGGLFGWSPSGGPTAGQMMTAIDQVQSTLQAMTTQINELTAVVKQGLDSLGTAIDDVGYTAATTNLDPAYQNVVAVQGDYTDFVSDQQIVASCVPAPPVTTPPTLPVAPPGECTYTDPVTNQQYNYKNVQVSDALRNLPSDLSDYTASITALEDDIGAGTDYFNLAILGDPPGKSALSYLTDIYLGETGNILMTAGSTLAQNFTAKALTHQAMAYFLSMAYERSLRSTVIPGGRADNISTAYLGEGYQNLPAFDPTANPLDNPVLGSGNLYDEVTYLQGVLPVPVNIVVDANPGGLMYTGTEDVGLGSGYLPLDAASRASCVTVVPFSADLACSTLTGPLNQFTTDMVGFAADQGSALAALYTYGEPPGTVASGLQTGWTLVTAADLAAILPRMHAVNDLGADYYYDPVPPIYPGVDSQNMYPINVNTYAVCLPDHSNCEAGSVAYPNVIDWLALSFQYRDGTERTCTWAVGQANDNTNPCFDMPAMIARPLEPGEDYLP